MRGKIQSVNTGRGFAFLKQPGGPDVFLHVSALAPDSGLVWGLELEGREIEFNVVHDEHGRPKAADVRPVDTIAGVRR